MRNICKNSFFFIVYALGYHRLLLRRIKRGRFVPVLNLHRVSPHKNAFYNPMHPQVFEALLVFLKKNFCVTSLSGLRDDSDARPSVVLSFDDGYYDFVEYAMPLLHKYNISANQNIIISSVETGIVPMHQRLYDYLNAAPRSLINELRVPGFETRLADESDRGKMKFGLALSRFLKRRSRKERLGLWEAIESYFRNAGGKVTTRMMNIRDVIMAAKTHEIGAHSYAHDSMGFEDISFFKQDYLRCMDFFERVLRQPLRIYAFPQGDCNHEQVELLREAGVPNILLVDELLSKRTDSVIYRLTISGESRKEVILQALGYKARRH